MQKKITVYTVTDSKASKSFTTKKLAETAINTLKVFGITATLTKEVKTIELD